MIHASLATSPLSLTIHTISKMGLVSTLTKNLTVLLYPTQIHFNPVFQYTAMNKSVHLIRTFPDALETHKTQLYYDLDDYHSCISASTQSFHDI